MNTQTIEKTVNCSTDSISQKTEIRFTDGVMKLKNGILTLDVKDPQPKGKPTGDQPATGAERAKKFEAKKRAAGYKRDWIDPDTLALARELGSIQMIREDRDRLLDEVQSHIRTIAAQHSEIEVLHAKILETGRPWWKILRLKAWKTGVQV
jgi:hypothetical protein